MRASCSSSVRFSRGPASVPRLSRDGVEAGACGPPGAGVSCPAGCQRRRGPRDGGRRPGRPVGRLRRTLGTSGERAAPRRCPRGSPACDAVGECQHQGREGEDVESLATTVAHDRAELVGCLASRWRAMPRMRIRARSVSSRPSAARIMCPYWSHISQGPRPPSSLPAPGSVVTRRITGPPASSGRPPVPGRGAGHSQRSCPAPLDGGRASAPAGDDHPRRCLGLRLLTPGDAGVWPHRRQRPAAARAARTNTPTSRGIAVTPWAQRGHSHGGYSSGRLRGWGALSSPSRTVRRRPQVQPESRDTRMVIVVTAATPAQGGCARRRRRLPRRSRSSVSAWSCPHWDERHRILRG